MQSDIEGHQNVTLYPSYAYFDRNTNAWTLTCAGFVYSDGRDGVGQRVFLRLLQQVLDVDENFIRSNEHFAERITGFLQDPQRGKSVALKLADGKTIVSAPSRRSGHVRFSVMIPMEVASPKLKAAIESGSAEPMPYSVVFPKGDPREVSSTAEVISPRGVSVITDIDDTIKISQVAHRRQLLHNTFLHDFVPVPGMAELYGNWKSQGISFHYVSSSPWQLFSPLNEFLAASHFPSGSFHLRTYRFGDPSVLRLFIARKRNKFNIIESILQQFPERHFVLVGDSGEKDAEIYGKVARRYPRQVKRILIRQVDGRPWTKKRVAKAFRGVPEDQWQTFQVPTQIRDLAISE